MARKKNSFKIFEKKKEVEKHFVEDTLDSIMESKEGFIHIPSDAFKKISHSDRYSYLKNGMYISKQLLHIDHPKLIDIGYLSNPGHTCHERDGQIYLCYTEAKQLIKHFDAFIATPAEYLSAMEYLKLADSSLHWDIMNGHPEWLELCIDDDELYDGTIHDGDDLVFKNRLDHQYRQIDDFYLPEEIDPLAGIPDEKYDTKLTRKITLDMIHYKIEGPYGIPHGLYRTASVHEIEGQTVTWPSIYAEYTSQGWTPISMRLCKKVKKSDKVDNQ